MTVKTVGTFFFTVLTVWTVVNVVTGVTVWIIVTVATVVTVASHNIHLTVV